MRVAHLEEGIDDESFWVRPTVDTVADTLSDTRPPTSPVERAQQYDWDAVADQAERAYQRALTDSW